MEEVEGIMPKYIMAKNNKFWQGARESLPLVVGAVPFGITCGIMGLTAGMTPLETVLMSAMVFAGAAQFVAISMLAAGLQELSLMVVTTLLINLRHLLMGASLTPYLISLPLVRQAVLSFGLTDETYAITMAHINREGYDENYQLGTNVCFYCAWILATLAGVLLSGYIGDPLRWGLDFAMPAIFLAMLVPQLTNKTAVLVGLAAALVATAGALYLPGKWYIIAACLAAAVTGGWLDKGEEQ